MKLPHFLFHFFLYQVKHLFGILGIDAAEHGAPIAVGGWWGELGKERMGFAYMVAFGLFPIEQIVWGAVQMGAKCGELSKIELHGLVFENSKTFVKIQNFDKDYSKKM